MEALFNDIRRGDLASVSLLMDDNPEMLHSRDQRGATPLILAAYYEQEDIVSYLLQKGAAVDQQDASGNTALMGVCFKGFTGLAELLLNAGANANASNAMGGSCLIFATTFKHQGIIKLLLAHGADVHWRDARGNTAADHARMQGLNEIAELLENT